MATTANPDQAAYYANLGRRVVELKAQSVLLNQLAQEHLKRAGQTPGDQPAKAQWENDLAKELGDQAATFASVLDNTRKEKLAFEQAHPELHGNGGAAPSQSSNADQAAYLAKLEERLAAVQQETAETLEAGKVYAAQLQTNAHSLDFSRIASLLQDNGNEVKRLKKEAADLELKKLEFRALTRE